MLSIISAMLSLGFCVAIVATSVSSMVHEGHQWISLIFLILMVYSWSKIEVLFIVIYCIMIFVYGAIIAAIRSLLENPLVGSRQAWTKMNLEVTNSYM